MKLIKKKLRDLKPSKYNPRTHDDSFLESLEKSLDEFGYLEPIIWNKRTGRIVGGHARYKILKKQGVKEVEVVQVDLPENREKSLNLALNRIHGDWDEDKLELILKELNQEDLDLTGFDETEINEILDEIQEIEEDEIPEPPKEPKSKIGEIYLLGNHRVMCGNSTIKKDVEKLMGGGEANMVFTDPPYGVDLNSKNLSFESLGRGKDWGDIKGDVDPKELRSTLTAAFKLMKEYTATKTPWYIWHGGLTLNIFKEAADSIDLLIHRVIIWNKSRFVLSRGDYHWKHEPCLYGWIRGNRPPFYGGHNKDTVWDVEYGPNEYTMGRQHPTQKPVELCKIAINNSSKKGDILLDLFGGSGSTLIACEKTGRTCYIMEITPTYVDVIIQRWENLTGKKAELLET